jgi:hypothetical protein
MEMITAARTATPPSDADRVSFSIGDMNELSKRVSPGFVDIDMFASLLFNHRTRIRFIRSCIQ